MPGRQSTLQPRAKAAKKSKARGKRRDLDAFAIAEKIIPDKPKVRRSRLGDVEDDSASQQNSDAETQPSKRLKVSHRPSDNDHVESHHSGSNPAGLEDESDIDSDEAFGESDEERFEGFTFRGGASRRDSESGDDAEEDEDDFGEDAVDLAAAFDMAQDGESSDSEGSRAKSTQSLQQKARKVKKLPQAHGIHTDGESASDVGSESGDSSTLSASDDEGGDDIQKLSALRDLVATVQADTDKSIPQANRFGTANEHTAPSEFGLSRQKKLMASDLLPSINDPNLRRSLKLLTSDKKAKRSDGRGAIAGKLDVPLSKREQDRLDRNAAYDKSKETLDRWIDTVQSNRRAEHLSFPLQDPNDQSRTEYLTPGKPTNELESTIQSILEASNMAAPSGKAAEERIQEAEELQTNKLPLAEIEARRAELRKARDLLFREEVRAKRVKKIKSKAYRRVHRRQRENALKEEQQAMAAAGLDLSEGEQEKQDRQRAETRMGARHRESRWAKAMKDSGRAAWDEDARSGLIDTAKRDNDLRQRIEGARINDADNGATESSESESDLEDESTERQKIRDEIDGLATTDARGTSPKSRLSSMKFMQKADAARRLRSTEELENLRRDMDGDELTDNEDLEKGRQAFGPSPVAANGSTSARLDDNPASGPNDDFTAFGDIGDDGERSLHRTPAKPRSISQKTNNNQPRSAPEVSTSNSNPWLSDKKSKKKTSEVTLSEDKSLPANVPGLISQPKNTPPKRPKANDTQARPESGVDRVNSADSDSDSGELPKLGNQELVQRAFAGDDVVAHFENEKKETVGEEGEQVVDNTLPGWGSWMGEGLSKKERSRSKGRFLTTKEGIKPSDRKDAKLDKVVINQKRVKKVRHQPDKDLSQH